MRAADCTPAAAMMLGIAWHSRGVSDVFSPKPEELRAFHNRFLARFRAPGVRLCGFQLRWISCRSGIWIGALSARRWT
jgi:hypothetical protein